jgi:hypothetical protein
MNNRWSVETLLEGEIEVLAEFGRSRVVRLRNGRLEIRGGNPSERAEAKEWTSLFCHEALPGCR